MKICIVVDNLDPSAGWGRLAHEVGAGLRARGHTVGFVAQDGSAPDQLLSMKLRGYRMREVAGLVRSLYRLRRFLRQYDLVLCYDMNPYGLMVLAATRFLKVKVVVHALGTYSLFTGSWFRDIAIAWGYRTADRLFVISDFTRRQIEAGRRKIPDAVIVPVGVNLAQFRAVGEPSRPTPDPYIIGVGALKYRKGYHLSLHAFANIAAEFPRLRYYLVATAFHDAYQEEIEDFIKRNGLTERVIRMEGVTDTELAHLYAGAESFVLTPVSTPNAFEGFGMVYLEANACGIPVIGTRNSGAEAAIVDGINGLLVDADPERIADALRRVLSDQELARRLGTAGIAHVRAFAWPCIIDQHLVHFKEIIHA